MIIVLLLFFKSICLYCQRLVLHIHDRWINPKNVRLLKEAAEAKGSKFQIEEYRQIKKTKKRRYATNNTASAHHHHQNSSYTSPLSNTLADSENCRFCANTPQGYCRHHFHLQELQVQKQQRQQKFWCPLSGVVLGSSNSSSEYRQLRKIKRELKRNIQQQQQLKSAKAATIIYEDSSSPYSSPPQAPLVTASPPSSNYPSNSVTSSSLVNDSGYQTISLSTAASSGLDIEANSDILQQQQQSDLASISHDYVDIELPSPSVGSLVETTYSFETCCETPRRSPSPPISKTASFNSFASCEYSALSTSHL